MKKKKYPTTVILLNSSHIHTPIGKMIEIEDEKALYLLEFTNRKNIDKQLQQLQIKTNATIIPGKNNILDLVERELKLYFAGKLKNFSVLVHFSGTPFQQKAWSALQAVPYGHTYSYAQEAAIIGDKNACRAVANANSVNKIAIVVPCHRIIKTNGDLCGYAGGLERKQWLIEHEKNNTLSQ